MIYNALSFIIWALCAPFLLLFSFKSKFKCEYKNSLLARFFAYKNPPLKPCKYHFHACSLGEVASIQKLVEHFRGAKISAQITVTTATGYQKAKSFCDNVSFLPFEWMLPFMLKKCEYLVVFEAELWLNLFKYAKKSGAKTILLNARISEHSYKSYLRFSFYYKYLFSFVDLVLAQSKDDEIRLKSLGAKNIKVIGNVKSAVLAKPSKSYKKSEKHTICIASSHEKEEEQILNAIKLRDNEKLFIVPRHPQRFDKVCALAKHYAKANNLSFERFSQNAGLNSDINVIDALGELVNIYAISDVVLLCGSFEPKIGGHNPLECAQFGCGIISGEHYFNQKALYKEVQGIKVAKYEELEALVHEKWRSKIAHLCEFNALIKELE